MPDGAGALAIELPRPATIRLDKVWDPEGASRWGANMEFSAKSALSYGWETFKRRPWFFIGSTLVILIAGSIVNGVAAGIDSAITGDAKDPSIFGTLVTWIGGTLLSMGATSFYLKAHDDLENTTLGALWHPQPFWKYLLASILGGLAVGLGLLLLIVPGIIFALMFAFTPFLVIDRGLGAMEAMKESARITKGHKWTLLGLALLSLLVVLLGVLAFGVGVLVAVPVVSLAFTQVYRLLAGRVAPDATLAHPVA